MSSSGWTPAKATALLLERELFGMRFELDRIQALLNKLGNPQDTFRSVHVVGTNGKTSTTRFTAAALAAAGLKVGAYVSPHLTGFHERVLLSDAEGMSEVDPAVFADAVGRVAEASSQVEQEVLEGELVTQFELVTAAAMLVYAEAEVEVAVIEAGLGGRWDATNVLNSPKTVVLTSVGLDHTRWLGNDVESIATEKVAVVGEGDVLIVPSTLSDGPHEVAVEVAASHGAELRVVDAGDVGHVSLEAIGPFQRENFALAVAAAQNAAGGITEGQVKAAAAITIPGRMMVVDNEPLTILDGAHNPQGAERVSEALAELAEARSVVGVIGMLEDKDAIGFLKSLAPNLGSVIATSPLNPRALGAEELAEIVVEAGIERDNVIVEPDAHAAVIAARGISGKDGVVIVTGSIHLVGDLVSAPGERVVTSL